MIKLAALVLTLAMANTDGTLTFRSNSMPGWFAPQAREFRYPIATEFDFVYIDKSGEAVLQQPFISAESFYKGVAPVKHGQFVFEHGRRVLLVGSPYQYLSQMVGKDGQPFGPPCRNILPFIDDLTVFEDGGKYGVLDLQGHKLSTFAGYGCKNYSEGLLPLNTGNKWGYADKLGKLLIAARYDVAEPFQEGLALVADWSHLPARASDHCRFFLA